MFFILKEYVYLNQSGLLMDKYGVGECLDGPLKNFTNFLDNFFKVYLKKKKTHMLLFADHVCASTDSIRKETLFSLFFCSLYKNLLPCLLSNTKAILFLRNKCFLSESCKILVFFHEASIFSFCCYFWSCRKSQRNCIASLELLTLWFASSG